MFTNGSWNRPARTTSRSLWLTATVLLTLTACAVKTPVQTAAPEAAAHRQYQNVVFRSFTAMPEVPNPDAAMAECLRSAMDHLQLKNVYKRVEKQSAAAYAEPTLFVDLRLIDLRLVSSAARTWGGAFAGRSYIKVLVKLTDTRGEAVAEQELFGAPNAWGSAYSFGSSDRALPTNMGILVGDFVLTHTGRK